MKNLLVILIFSITSCDLTPSRTNFDSTLLRVAQEINSMCPMTVDKDTRLDNAAALSNKTFQYNYTLINTKIEDTDVQNMKNSFIPILNNKVKTNEGLELMRKNNVTLIYSYSDLNGKFLFLHKVTPDIYK